LLIGQVGWLYEWKAHIATPDLVVLIESRRKTAVGSRSASGRHQEEQISKLCHRYVCHRPISSFGTFGEVLGPGKSSQSQLVVQHHKVAIIKLDNN
jgi:hypothetical protein